MHRNRNGTARAATVLDEAAATSWGQAILRHNPEFNRIRARIAEGNVTFEERVQLITDLEGLHTFAGIINRTRRRDIGDFTIEGRKLSLVEFTPSQKQLHDELLAGAGGDIQQTSRGRQCQIHDDHDQTPGGKLPFLASPHFLGDILNRHLDELSWEEADNTEPGPTR